MVCQLIARISYPVFKLQLKVFDLLDSLIYRDELFVSFNLCLFHQSDHFNLEILKFCLQLAKAFIALRLDQIKLFLLTTSLFELFFDFLGFQIDCFAGQGHMFLSSSLPFNKLLDLSGYFVEVSF